MDRDIEKLLDRYYEGETTLEEERQLRQFFQGNDVPAHLQSHAAQFSYFAEAREQHPSLAFANELAARLDPPKQGPVSRLTSWFARIAAGLILLIVGFAGGMLYHGSQASGNGGNIALSGRDRESFAEMRKVLDFEQIAVTSASERIHAVNQSYELSEVDRNITQLLINTLNFDPNINVRLAAGQALLHFVNEPDVTEALIQSLEIQSEPNVQIMLIEALTGIREQRAAGQFQRIVKNREVLDIVRLKAEEGLDRLGRQENPSS